MTRLKKLPEEHLLKPPSEVTKSSIAADKAHKKAATKATRSEQAHTASGSETSVLHQDGNLESSDTVRPVRTEGADASRSETTLHALSEPGQHRGHIRRSASTRVRRHQHHPHHSADPEATPERIAEAVFNPKPSNVYTPFTYVVEPAGRDVLRAEGRRPTSLVLSHDKSPSQRRDEAAIDACPTTASTTMTGTTNPLDSADEGSDATATGSKAKWAETNAPQPHAREQARWNAAEGVWERRRGRGYGKMRTMPRRRVSDIERPFFKRIGRGQQDGGANDGLGLHQAVRV